MCQLIIDLARLSSSVFLDALVPTIIDDDALNRSVFREGDRRENEAPFILDALQSTHHSAQRITGAHT
jgi:hypothetical protein